MAYESDIQASVVSLQDSSLIASQWANGDDTTEIDTDSGKLPSLAKFMVENVSEASNTKYNIDLSSGDVTISSLVLNDNLYFRAVNNTVTRTITFPNIPKLFYVENTGTEPLSISIGSSTVVVAVGNTVIIYADGTTDGLKSVLESLPVNNYTATAAPTVNDDETEGYIAGSRWVDNSMTPADIYLLVDATEGAANWVQTSISLEDLGSMSSQNADSVNITGGIISGITDLAIADGGTGASTASAARTNLGLGNVDNTSDINKPISTATQTAINNLGSTKLSTEIVPQVLAEGGTDTTAYAWSAERVKQAINSIASGLSIGVEQELKNATSSRLLNTTYTNTTGKPIFVVIGAGISTTGYGALYLTLNGGSEFSAGAILNQSGVTSGGLSFLVPNGNTYKVRGAVTAGSLTYTWWELTDEIF